MTWKQRSLRVCLGFYLIAPGAAYSDEFSIAVVSDSQYYTEVFPAIFEAQMQWIVDNQVAENIAYVAQLGDLKDDLSCDNKLIAAPVGPARTEWEIVDDAFARLETATSLAQPDGIPYGVVPGNHDFDQIGGTNCPNYTTQRPLGLYNNDPLLTAAPHLGFPPSRFAGRAYYGGSRVAGSNEDNYTLFEAGGVGFIVINLGYRQDASPSTPELTWANDLLSTQFPDRLGIVTSHYLMECNAVNPGTGCPGGSPINQLGNYGAQVYGALSGNPNLFMFLSAHRRGESYRIQDRPGMRPVHMLMSNYQSNNYPTGDPTNPATFSSLPTNEPGGAVIQAGNSGFMRIMRFDTDTGLVEIETFSPPMAAVPAVADPDGPGPILGTPAIAARSLLTSIYFPTIQPPPASSQLNTGVHTGTASNLTIDFTGYVPFGGPTIVEDSANRFEIDFANEEQYVGNPVGALGGRELSIFSGGESAAIAISVVIRDSGGGLEDVIFIFENISTDPIFPGPNNPGDVLIYSNTNGFAGADGVTGDGLMPGFANTELRVTVGPNRASPFNATLILSNP